MRGVEWKAISGGTGVLYTYFALIPTYRCGDGTVVLIDSGAMAHPELAEDLDRLGLRVRAVLCTHLHPDHIANNRLLIDRYGAEIWASAREVRDVVPRYASLRADPLEEKWLWTQPDYPIRAIAPGTASLRLGDAVFELLPTPGHVEGHLSVVTPDGVCCLGDALISRSVLDSSSLPYMEYDVDLAVESMARLGDTDYPLYVAAHREVIRPESLRPLVDANIKKELGLYDLLRRVIDRPMPMEEAITAFMSAAGVGREIMLRRSSMRGSAATRFQALIRAGELEARDGMVSPASRR